MIAFDAAILVGLQSGRATGLRAWAVYRERSEIFNPLSYATLTSPHTFARAGCHFNSNSFICAAPDPPGNPVTLSIFSTSFHASFPSRCSSMQCFLPGLLASEMNRKCRCSDIGIQWIVRQQHMRIEFSLYCAGVTTNGSVRPLSAGWDGHHGSVSQALQGVGTHDNRL